MSGQSSRNDQQGRDRSRGDLARGENEKHPVDIDLRV